MEHSEQFGFGQGVRPKVFFWPDFSRTNPYAAMLYASARGAFDISPGTLSDAIAALPMPGTPGPAVIFHLHWLNAFTVRAKTEEQARQDFTDFLSQLDLFQSRGGRVVWTIHNIVSHDTKFRDLEIEMSALIATRADVLHFHAKSSVPEVRAVFPFPAERIAISAHGNYVSAYPDDGLSKTAARDAFGFDQGEDLVLSLGLVRPYKGHDLMIAAFRALLPDRPRLRLLIAGRVFSGALTDPVLPLTTDEAARITIADGFIEPERIQYFLRAADVKLFPYRSLLTSGSLLLALTFGLPAIIPGVGMAREVLDGHDAGIIYPTGSDAGTITAALASIFARKDGGTLQRMSANAHARARDLDWPDFAPVLNRALESGK